MIAVGKKTKTKKMPTNKREDSLDLLVLLIRAILIAKFWGFSLALSASCVILEAALGSCLGVPVLLPGTGVLPAHDMEVGSANVPLGRAALHERD